MTSQLIQESQFAHPAGKGFEQDRFRALVKTRLKFSADEYGGEIDGDFNQDPAVRDWVLERAKKPAAVLIALVEREGALNVVLTKRTEHLASHSGQVAFPGGKIDAGDVNEFAAAVRESEEEIGLDRRAVEIIGRLPDYYTGSGYIVAPIVSLIPEESRFIPEPGEVEYVFEVPLSFLMNPDNHVVGSREFQGRRRYYLEMPYEGHYIWGVTAGIIRAMYQRLYV